MANSTILNETARSPIDGTESVRLATAGANWKATLADIFSALGSPSFGGRITLTSATPVLTATVSGATTVYFTPYNGNMIPIYDGTTFDFTDFSEMSQATTDATESPAAVGASSNYDIFVWNDAGTLRATRGPAWSSATSRGTGAGTTELQLLSGIYVNKVAITNGPGANLGTYVGSIRSNASSTIDWTLGGSASGGSAAVLNVWNYYNRVNVQTRVTDSGVTYSYASSTIRAKRGSATNRITFLSGLAEDAIYVGNLTTCVSNSTAGGGGGIGLDTTTAFSGGQAYMFNANGSNVQVPCTSAITIAPQIGSHFVSSNEWSSVATTNFDNDSVDALCFCFRM